jgi:hypothetical protein
MSSNAKHSDTQKPAEALGTYVGVELDASDPPLVQTPASSGNDCLGIVEEGAEAGAKSVSVVDHGPTRITCAEEMEQGEFFAINTDGHAVPATTGDVALGFMREDGVEDDDAECFVLRQPEALA